MSVVWFFYISQKCHNAIFGNNVSWIFIFSKSGLKNSLKFFLNLRNLSGIRRKRKLPLQLEIPILGCFRWNVGIRDEVIFIFINTAIWHKWYWSSRLNILACEQGIIRVLSDSVIWILKITVWTHSTSYKKENRTVNMIWFESLPKL